MNWSLRAIAAAPALLALAFATSATAGGCLFDHDCYERVHTPDVYATVATPVVVAPARSEIVHSAAVYGTVRQTVEVRPARVVHSVSPGVYQTVHREVVVAPAHVAWQHTVDRHGREQLCRVHVPAVTRTVAQTVMVRPPERIAHVIPAVRREIERPVLVRPAARRIVTHPPLVAVSHRQVLVQRGHASWQRAGFGHGFRHHHERDHRW